MRWTSVDLQLHAACAYPSWDHKEHAFEREDYDAHFIVHAIKGNVDKLGKRFLKMNGNSFDRTNYKGLQSIFYQWAAGRIEELGLSNVVLVPIPNSNATPNVETFSTKELAQGIAKMAKAQMAVFDGLRFSQVMQPASKGGPRDKETLYSNMVVISSPPSGQPVLLDDVCSGGGHLFAAQRRLGMPNDTHAIVCGRTVHEHRENMISNIDEKLSDWWVR